jgi:hypothetical protein
MAETLSIHRPWEDWLNLAIGVLIAASPWLAGHSDNSFATWNAAIVGAVVIALAVLELTALRRWEEAAQMLYGFWLLASPFAFHYVAHALGTWHFALGSLLILLALLELWQDWHRSDVEMAGSSPT